jgi:hypothetical protein
MSQDVLIKIYIYIYVKDVQQNSFGSLATSFFYAQHYSVYVYSLKFAPFVTIRFHSSELPMSFGSNDIRIG